MKYLKRYNESDIQSDIKLLKRFSYIEDIKDMIKDILVELEDDGYSIHVKKSSRTVYTFVLDTIDVKICSTNIFKYTDILEYVERLKEYMLSVGFEVEYDFVYPSTDIHRYSHNTIIDGIDLSGYHFYNINFVDHKNKRPRS